VHAQGSQGCARAPHIRTGRPNQGRRRALWIPTENSDCVNVAPRHGVLLPVICKYFLKKIIPVNPPRPNALMPRAQGQTLIAC
jgi:hypothetical protein